MTARTQYDMVQFTVSGTPGTGAITVLAAVTGYQTPASASVPTGATVGYGIIDGANWEIGSAPYTVAGTSLARGPIFSSNSNAAISCTSSAIVRLTTLAEDINFIITSTGNSAFALAAACLATGPELGAI